MRSAWRQAPLSILATVLGPISVHAVAQQRPAMNIDLPADVRWFGQMPGAPPDIWGIYAQRWPGERRDLQVMSFAPVLGSGYIAVRMTTLCAVAYVGPASPTTFLDLRVYEESSGQSGPVVNFLPLTQRTVWFEPGVVMRHVDTSFFGTSVWAIGPPPPSPTLVEAVLVLVRVELDYR